MTKCISTRMYIYIHIWIVIVPQTNWLPVICIHMHALYIHVLYAYVHKYAVKYFYSIAARCENAFFLFNIFAPMLHITIYRACHKDIVFALSLLVIYWAFLEKNSNNSCNCFYVFWLIHSIPVVRLSSLPSNMKHMFYVTENMMKYKLKLRMIRSYKVCMWIFRVDNIDSIILYLQ